MTFYDIIILVLLLGAVLFGYWKGLAWQIASVAAIVVSYFAAYRFRDQVAQYVQAEYPFNRIAAMLIIFVACSLIIWLAYAYVNRSLENAELDGFNRQMGALVGAFLGILLCMVVTMFSVSLLGQPAHDSIHYSKFGPYVLRGISMVRSVVPEELSASLDPHFDRFYQQTGYTPDRPINSFPAYQNPGANPNPVPGGSQYTFNPNSGQSFQGNWGYQPNTQGYQPNTQGYQPNTQGYQPNTQGYQPNTQGYQPNTQGYQPNTNGSPPNYNQTQTQARFGSQPNVNNQGTTYLPQTQRPAPAQPSQGFSLPPVEIKLDETILNGAGQFIRDRLTTPNGN